MKLLICDDHSLVSEGIELMLNKEKKQYETHIVTSGKEALSFLRQQHVDVLLLDISMPDMDGIEVLNIIQAEKMEVNVLMLTMHNQVMYIKKAMAKGANGYVLKNTTKESLIRAINTVAKGGTFVDDKLTSLLIEDLRTIPKVKNSETIKLTSREIDILKLAAQNKKTKEIADILFISINTVQSHKKNLYSKLNIHSVSELVNYAYKHGYVEL